MKRYPPAIYLLWIGLFLLPVPLIAVLDLTLASDPQKFPVYDAGIVAFCWLSASVILSTRPRWLDRKIGLPSIYAVHGSLAMAAVAIAFLHWTNITTTNVPVILSGQIAWYLLLFGVLFALFFLSGAVVDRLSWMAALKQWVNQRWKHQLSVWIHRINLFALALIILHVHLIERVRSNTPFILLFDFYAVIAFGTYCYWSLAAKHVPAAIVKSSILGRTLRLTAKLPSAQSGYRPGDYYFLRSSLISDAHPFSVTHTPKGDGEVDFTIRIVGDDTSKLTKLKPGDTINLEGPFGRFDSVVGAQADRPLVLIGLGVGIAPLISLAEAYQETRLIRILWSVRSQQDTYYDEQLKSLRSDTLSYHRQTGRFTQAQLVELLGTDGETAKNALYITVGPATAVIGIEHTLRRLGINSNNLIDERYGM